MKRVHFANLGSLFISLCCLGLPAVLSFATAIGLGFIINDAILLPLLVVFLSVGLVATAISYRFHKNIIPLVLSVISSIGLYVFIFVWLHVWLIYVFIGVLTVSSLVDIFSTKKCKVACKINN